MAPSVGSAPTSRRLTAGRFTIKLTGNQNGDPDGLRSHDLLLEKQACCLATPPGRKKLVGGAGNAPVVAYRHSLTTAGLQTAGRNTSRNEVRRSKLETNRI